MARSEPFDAVELDLAGLWEGLGPATSVGDRELPSA